MPLILLALFAVVFVPLLRWQVRADRKRRQVRAMRLLTVKFHADVREFNRTLGELFIAVNHAAESMRALGDAYAAVSDSESRT